MPDRYVATDSDGLQHHEGYRRRWSLPVRRDDRWQPGEVVEPDEHGKPVVLDAGELLDQLGECVFVAEPVGDAGAARLVASTSWSQLTAANFALDCVEHLLKIVPGSAEAELPGGGTLGEIIASARRYLITGAGTDAHRLGFVSRIASHRRLRREGTAIGDAAFAAAAQAEGQGVDILSDPAWETLAAARDAVLAAVEAVRHVALPFLADRETRKYEALEERRVAEVDEVDTPWGRFAVGGGGLKYVPSWVSARDAAERSRQAAADLGGPEAGEAERSWQARRLVERLGTE
ncbi:MAG: hypothetical protein ABR972_06260 [Acidimicrobiales bacterium]